MSSGADSDLVRLVKVVVISPVDVTAERDVVELVVGELNREPATGRRRVVRLLRWERDARPGLHPDGPQGLINEQMDVTAADIVVAIFWTRIGTPTGDERSGTAYELKRAYAAWEERGRPDVLVYFCERAHRPTSAELAQWQEVHRLRDELPERLMHWSYDEVGEFERLVREHLRRAIASAEGRARREEPLRGLDSLLGSVRVRVEGDGGSFVVAGEHSAVHDVRPPGAVIGVGPEADARLTGRAAEGKVSRRHLVVRPSGREWTVADWGSTNGTHEVDAESGAWRALPPEVPVPVEDGMLLCLGPDLVVRLELCIPAPAGGATPRVGGPGSRQARIRPPALERLAIALLERRRADPADRAIPSTEHLARTLSAERKAVKRGLRDLRELAPVQACLTGKHPEQLADALELAFPYLVASRPEADAPVSLADRGEPPRPAPIA